MSNTFPSFSINDGDWVRVRQFIQRVSTHDLQGGGSLVPYIGAVSNVNLGAHTLTTTGAVATGNLTISSTLLLASGSITDSTGAISFSNENLSTTGTLASGTHTIGTLVLAAGSITDTGGTVTFDNENLSTTGSITGTSFISGTLTLTGASITDSTGIISFGNENLNTSGTLTLGVVGTTPYPLYIKAISGVSTILYIKDANNYTRSLMQSIGAQGWYLNTGAAESGSIVYATPGGTNIAILLNTYDHTTGSIFYYRNNFYLAHCDTIFRMGFSADNFAMLAFHKGSKLQINYGDYDFDFQVSGNTDTNLFYCNAGTDRVGISTATPATTLDVLGTSRFGDSATNYAQFAADGELTLAGTARVKKRIMVPLAAVKLGAVDPPSEGAIDGFKTLDFDGGTKDEEVFKPFCGPLDWASGTGCTVNLRFFVDTAPAGAANVVWQIEVKSIACEGIVDFSSGTSTYIDVVAITTGTPANDKKVHCSELTIPAGDLIEGGCLFIRLHRDATHASDTFTGDARLLKAFITYTADKLGQAT